MVNTITLLNQKSPKPLSAWTIDKLSLVSIKMKIHRKKEKNMSDNSVKERVILGSLHKNYMKFGTKKSVLRWKRKKSSVSFRKTCVKGRFDNVAEKHYQMFVICRTFSMSKAMNANVVLLRILFFIRLWYFNDVFHYDVSFFLLSFIDTNSNWYK